MAHESKATSRPAAVAVIADLRSYVLLQAARRRGESAAAESPDDYSPLSVNLDLTTACNYACDHCVDADILNKGVRFDLDQVFESLSLMTARGLRTVIVIGGGEPTVHPRFAAAIRHIKSLGLSVGLVTNGSRLDRVREVAEEFTAGDWIRLSLDSGRDGTFQAMHRPRKPITLEQICAGVAGIKGCNPQLSIGFSFIVTWRGCTANDTSIHENLNEMVDAARLAKASGFDYISYKPFLVRLEANNAEVVTLNDAQSTLEDVIRTLHDHLDEARQFEGDGFRVVASTNLRLLGDSASQAYTNQPHTCHMTYFRQVLSPFGVFNCPVYRNVDQAKIGEKHAYATEDGVAATGRRTLEIIDSFDAHEECREVTCLYNSANWFIEDLIENPEKLNSLTPSDGRPDYFL
jgi:hypothetical protein